MWNYLKPPSLRDLTLVKSWQSIKLFSLDSAELLVIIVVFMDCFTAFAKTIKKGGVLWRCFAMTEWEVVIARGFSLVAIQNIKI